MKATGPDNVAVEVVLDRDRWKCVVCGFPVHQGVRGFDWVLHHRRPRAMGGTRRADANSPSNLLTLCSPCHHDVEAHRATALVDGLLVPQHSDPATTPVLVNRCRWLYLTADGRYSDDPPDSS